MNVMEKIFEIRSWNKTVVYSTFSFIHIYTLTQQRITHCRL